VKIVGKEFKWQISYDKEGEIEWDVWWTDTAVPPEQLARMK
jgi:hypothetical protein